MSNNKNKKYWRSLGYLKDSPEYRKQILEEFREDLATEPRQFSRRRFLTIMGASMALAGLAGCRRPVEKIVPYVDQPEEVIPGLARYYATTMPLGNSAYGMVVETHEGRPTKIEGNPKHPSTMGASDIFMQASILNLYDPDRAGKIKYKGKEKTLDDFQAFWKAELEKYSKNKGEGLAILSEAFSSPTLERLKAEFHKRFPKANWGAYEPINDESILNAIKNQTGKSLRPHYHFDKADVILSIDSDFLNSESESIIAARRFAQGRKISSPNDKMNRLYVVESGFSITGSMADHRKRLKSGQIGSFLLALIQRLKSHPVKIDIDLSSFEHAYNSDWLEALAEDLINAQGRSLIIVGRKQPERVHELAMNINDALGNLNKTIQYTEDNKSLYPGNPISLDAETLIIFGGNPIYNSSPDFRINNLLNQIKNSIRFGEYYDETSRACDWFIPRAHFLESWSDARASDGILSVIQPMITPLFDGISDVEFVEMTNSGEIKTGYELVRETWRNIIKSDFERGWRRVLHDGILVGSESKTVDVRAGGDNFIKFVNSIIQKSQDNQFEIVLNPSQLYDGRFANNGWLQELPDPITKLVWDNAALISVNTAKIFALENGDIINLKNESSEINIPVWIVPGSADNSIHLSLGYGQKQSGRIADNIGFNTYLIRNSFSPNVDTNAKSITKTGKKHVFANTQDHDRMEERAIYRESTLTEYKNNPKFAKEMVEHPPLESIYADYDYSKGYQWGMVIDLNACIGCGVCTISCQSENNIPIVGKKQVGNGREMHWMRNDRYFSGDDDNPSLVIMPVTCQHCENAPCEQVCPVAATTHDKEGLNTMAYNRCIGTRYCSNNCPYKVRKFNFFNYTKELPEVSKMAQNPDVTVRSRGVMEKCTFCIQRLKQAKKAAKISGQFKVKTACQQACPTGAIHFGNINEIDSKIKGLKKTDRNYELLEEYNVRPRNSYLARVRNLNPKLVKAIKTVDNH